MNQDIIRKMAEHEPDCGLWACNPDLYEKIMSAQKNDEFRQLPPTPENLERIGWKIDRDSGPSGVSLESLGGVTIWYCLKNWNISDHEAEIQIPTPATMGDVLDWHRLLGIPVKGTVS